MLKAILIDVGGPLVDDHDFYSVTDRLGMELLASTGQQVGEEQYREVLNSFTSRCFPSPRSATLWHFVRPDLTRYRRLKETIRERRRWTPRLRPEALEAVEALAQHYKLGLAGNQPARIKDLLDPSGLLEHFRFQQVSEEMGVTKPNPQFFQMILDSLEVEPREAVMVGDRLDHDIYPPKLMGIKTIRVLVGPYAMQEPPTPFHEPDITISSVAKLPDVVLDGRSLRNGQE